MRRELRTRTMADIARELGCSDRSVRDATCAPVASLGRRRGGGRRWWMSLGLRTQLDEPLGRGRRPSWMQLDTVLRAARRHGASCPDTKVTVPGSLSFMIRRGSQPTCTRVWPPTSPTGSAARSPASRRLDIVTGHFCASPADRFSATADPLQQTLRRGASDANPPVTTTTSVGGSPPLEVPGSFRFLTHSIRRVGQYGAIVLGGNGSDFSDEDIASGRAGPTGTQGAAGAPGFRREGLSQGHTLEGGADRTRDRGAAAARPRANGGGDRSSVGKLAADGPKHLQHVYRNWTSTTGCKPWSWHRSCLCRGEHATEQSPTRLKRRGASEAQRLADHLNLAGMSYGGEPR